MRILQISNYFKPSWEAGGPPRAAYEISRRLVERGHEVTVYTTDGFKNRLNITKNRAIDVDGIKTYYFRNLSNFLARKVNIPIPYYMPLVTRKEIKNFDVIHIHEYRSFLPIFSYHYVKKHNVPFVLQARGSILPFFEKVSFKRLFDSIIGNSILNDANVLLALTETESQQYKMMGVSPDKIKILPNGIDSHKNIKNDFRSRYGITDDEIILLFLGRIHKIKGIDLLLNAFKDLVAEFQNIKLVIVGPDDGFENYLRSFSKEFKINEKVVFTGPLYGNRKFEAYSSSDVYILPSIYEAFPNTVLEALSFELPVIVTKGCSIANIIDKRCGLVIDYQKDDLKKALIDLIMDEGLRKNFGRYGKKLVNTDYSWSKVIDNLENVYNQIV